MVQGMTSTHLVDSGSEYSSMRSEHSQITGFARYYCELSFAPNGLAQNQRFHFPRGMPGFHCHNMYQCSPRR